LFFVLTGTLFLKTEWGTAEVQPGEIFTTKPGEWHEFQTHEKGCTLVEVMYVVYNPEDIEREKLGGPLEIE
jgi:quercetin dioxygenase-like cupin family protein